MIIYVVAYWAKAGNGGCWSAHYDEHDAILECERAQKICPEHDFWWTELELT